MGSINQGDDSACTPFRRCSPSLQPCSGPVQVIKPRRGPAARSKSSATPTSFLPDIPAAPKTAGLSAVLSF
jgi:hypothetical protein